MADTIKLLSVILLSNDPKEVEVKDVGDEDLTIAVNQLRKFGMACKTPPCPELNAESSTTGLPILPPIDDEIAALKQQMSENLATYLETTQNYEADLKYMKKVNSEMNKKISILTKEVEKQEQYSRRYNLAVDGVEYHEGEDTNKKVMDIFRAIGARVSYQDIDRSHRNGSWRGNKPPPILVKFTRHDAKDEVYFKRDVLRELSKFRYTYINENLTAKRSKIFREVRKEKSWDSWTYDGRIYVSQRGLNPKNRIISRIESKEDYERVFRKKFIT